MKKNLSREELLYRVLVLVTSGAGLALLVLVVAYNAQLGRTEGPAKEEPAPGTTKILEAQVSRVLEERMVDAGGLPQPYQRLELIVLSGEPQLKGQKIIAELGTWTLATESSILQPGDRVLITHIRAPEGERFVISDFIRLRPLAWLAMGFALLILLVGRGQGVRALAGTLASLLVIVFLLLPQILAGRNPVTMSIVAASLFTAASLYLIYGWRAKTHVALGGILLSLVITGGLASWFVGWARLTGLSSEEAAYLLQATQSRVNLRGIVLAGIIIGCLGFLEDIAVGQSSAIFELGAANPNLNWRELFRRGMNVGRDHIAAAVNTLVLAYVGASLPLVLLFSIYIEPFTFLVNRELVAEEIVRTLVGSIGLVATVPLTSLLASWAASWQIAGAKTEKEHP